MYTPNYIEEFESNDPSAYFYYCSTGFTNYNTCAFVMSNNGQLFGGSYYPIFDNNDFIWAVNGSVVGGISSFLPGGIPSLSYDSLINETSFCQTGCSFNSSIYNKLQGGIVIDKNNNKFLPLTNGEILELSSSNIGTTYCNSGCTYNGYGFLSGIDSMAVDNNGNLFVFGTGLGVSNLIEIPANNPKTPISFCQTGCTYNNSWYLPGFMAIDGNNNLWIINSNGITEIQANNLQNPITYCAKGSLTQCTYEIFPSNTIFNEMSPISIDESGNVWFPIGINGGYGFATLLGVAAKINVPNYTKYP
jgi:hypothetical protein